MKRYLFAGALLLALAGTAAAEDAVPDGMSAGDANVKQKMKYKQTYDKFGDIASAENDTDGDGVMDEKIEYKNGVAVKVERDTNGDGKMDETEEPGKAVE